MIGVSDLSSFPASTNHFGGRNLCQASLGHFVLSKVTVAGGTAPLHERHLAPVGMD